MQPQTLFQSFLFGWVFWLCLTLGCLGFTLIHHAIRPSWSLATLRLLEAGNKMLILMAPLFLVILLGLKELYPWARPDVVQHDPVLQMKSVYLNPAFFTIRSIGYFLIWGFLAWRLNTWSRQQDKTGDASLIQKRADLAGPGIVIFVLTVTFAFTDWVMSLEPHWYSTIYGVWFVVGQGLAAAAFLALYVTRNARRKPWADIIALYAERREGGLLRDIGNLMLTFTMLWGYISLSQFLIMWSANLPDEVAYYSVRGQGGWNVLGTLNLMCQFFLPFFLLLSGRTKRTPQFLGMVAVLILVTRVLDLYWSIIPFFQEKGHPFEPLNYALPLVMFVVIGAGWLACFAWQLKQAPILPNHDDRLPEGLVHAQA